MTGGRASRLKPGSRLPIGAPTTQDRRTGRTGMGLKIASLQTPQERTPQRLSLCMIMRDEEEHLARCLESVQGVVDEIVPPTATRSA